VSLSTNSAGPSLPPHQPELPLSLPLSSDVIAINGRCVYKREGRVRMVCVAGLPMHHWAEGDATGQAHAMVSLVQCGYAEQTEVARAFGCSTRTLRRYERQYEVHGMAGLGRSGGRPLGQRAAPSPWVQTAALLQQQGVALRTIAERLKLSVGVVSEWLSRPGQGDTDPPAAPPFDETTPAPIPKNPQESSAGLWSDPSNRQLDRIFARLGKLQDADPLFASAKHISRAGVLLAVPALLQSGILTVAQEVYGSIGPAFYGLRTIMMTFLFMALLRIKRPEGLKEHLPAELGKIMGLDRAPEVKTVRRKLDRLSGTDQVKQFAQKLSERRVAQRGSMMGFLYVDGHVRVYHGKRKLAKAYATRMRLALPATTDYWVNDQDGDPVLVITAEWNEAMTTILPKVLEEVRRLVGERRVTIVFDRGGWSPKLFVKILALGFDILTYRKGSWAPIPEGEFNTCTQILDEREVSYRLNDRNIRLLKGKLRLRQITRWTDTGHQTPIVTSRKDLSALELAYRMFERWRQENFFKYMREEYLLDALVDYDVEPENPERSVPNPERRPMDHALAQARAQLKAYQVRYGQALSETPVKARSTIRKFKKAHQALEQRIQHLQKRIKTLQEKRQQIPRRVQVKALTGEPVLRLVRERQQLISCIKMVAYQAESDLLALLRPYYARADQEGRTLITTAFQSAADLDVSKNELRVTLAPLSSPHRSQAIGALCQSLNAMNVCFPGTSLRMRFAVAPDPA